MSDDATFLANFDIILKSVLDSISGLEHSLSEDLAYYRLANYDTRTSELAHTHYNTPDGHRELSDHSMIEVVSRHPHQPNNRSPSVPQVMSEADIRVLPDKHCTLRLFGYTNLREVQNTLDRADPAVMRWKHRSDGNTPYSVCIRDRRQIRVIWDVEDGSALTFGNLISPASWSEKIAKRVSGMFWERLNSRKSSFLSGT